MTEADSNASGVSRPAWLPLLLLPAITASVFSAYTGQIWEDFFITYRHTENLVAGNGLVYQPTERVHGFTSVLNTLIPAVPGLVTPSFSAAFLFYRLTSILALLAGVACLFRALQRRLGFDFLGLGVVTLLLATSVKIIAYTVNGQEAGFLVGFLAIALAAAVSLSEGRQWLWLGLAWGGLLYTRPDSPIEIAVTAIVAVATFGQHRAILLRRLARAVAVATGTYLPWFVFAWIYYGSPIPHTIVAKSARLLVDGSVTSTILSVWSGMAALAGDFFGPIYGPGGWPDMLVAVATLTGLACAFYWVAPVHDRFGRTCSAGLCLLLVYLAFIQSQRLAYPWYFPPACLLAILIVARWAQLAWSQHRRLPRIGAALVVGLLGAVSISFFALSHVQLRIQQEVIEDGTRKQVGLWLREHASPGDTVFVECLGYVGYFSGMKIFDFPGLVSPEVVRARREHGNSFGAVPTVLKPDWIVARPWELQGVNAFEANRTAYEIAATFDARPDLERYGSFAGKPYPVFDAVFVILRRKHDASPP